MIIYDITQELFGGKVYPGDPVPSYERISDMAQGALYNLTSIHLGAHNGTHLDAPFHFDQKGKSIEQVELARGIGPCSVLELSNYDTKGLRTVLSSCQKRLLVKGDYTITIELARLINHYEIELVGVEGQSVGPEEAPMEVHLELLGKEVILLEGIVLKEVPVGDYFLFAAPIKAGGSDGAPCRAILLKDDKSDTCNS